MSGASPAGPLTGRSDLDAVDNDQSHDVTANGELIGQLADHLGTVMGVPVSFVGRAPGNSHDGFVFATAGGRKVLIRLDPEVGPFLHYDGAGEARLMSSLAQVGVPVPAVLDAGGPDLFGAPFLVIEWIEGAVHHPRRAADLDRDTRLLFAREMADVLGQLHGVQLDAIDRGAYLGTTGGVDDSSGDLHSSLFDQFDAVLDTLEILEAPVLDYVRIWLERHLRDSGGPATLVHGDFRLANLVWQGPRIAAVLDWETARIGNPLFDVGWMCMSAHNGSDIIMGLVSRDEFVQMYRDATGRAIDDRDVVLWQVAASWVRGCTEVRLADLALRSREPGSVEARDLSWQFGAHRTDAELLRLIETYEAR